MDWPTVTLLLGLLVPITVALVKLLPSRGTFTINGQKTDLKTDIAVLTTKYESFVREVDQLRSDMGSRSEKLEATRAMLMGAARDKAS